MAVFGFAPASILAVAQVCEPSLLSHSCKYAHPSIKFVQLSSDFSNKLKINLIFINFTFLKIGSYSEFVTCLAKNLF